MLGATRGFYPDTDTYRDTDTLEPRTSKNTYRYICIILVIFNFKGATVYYIRKNYLSLISISRATACYTLPQIWTSRSRQCINCRYFWWSEHRKSFAELAIQLVYSISMILPSMHLMSHTSSLDVCYFQQFLYHI